MRLEVAKKRLTAAVLPALLLASCGEFREIFETRVNASHHATTGTGAGTSSKANRPAARGSETETAVRDPIVTRQGTYYFVKPGDTLAAIAKKYRTEWDAVAQINDLYDSDLVVGRRLFIPHRKNLQQYLVVTRVITEDRTRSVRKSLSFVWPIGDVRVTSVFGHRRGRPHDGVDIGAKVGTSVLAAEEGRVIFSERFAGYGNLIVIKHPNDYFTAYAHNSRVLVREGQHVKKGQEIAFVGMTGRTTGPHLHFEMRRGIDAVDPLSVLPKL